MGENAPKGEPSAGRNEMSTQELEEIVHAYDQIIDLLRSGEKSREKLFDQLLPVFIIAGFSRDSEYVMSQRASLPKEAMSTIRATMCRLAAEAIVGHMNANVDRLGNKQNYEQVQVNVPNLESFLKVLKQT